MQDIYKDYETEELVAMYQTTQREDLLQEILTRNNGLMLMWANRYSNIPYADLDDLMEECRIACWRAVVAFDGAKGYTFTTYLKGCVSQNLNRLYNEATRKKRFTGSEHISYEELVEINREGGTEVESSFSIECKEYSSIEVREFLDSISGTVKDIAVMLLDGMSKVEVAKALNCAPATVTYHIRRLQSAYIGYFG